MTNEAKLEFVNPVLGNNLLSDALVLGCVTSLGELLGLFELDTIANLLKWSILNITFPSFIVDFISSSSPLSFMW